MFDYLFNNFQFSIQFSIYTFSIKTILVNQNKNSALAYHRTLHTQQVECNMFDDYEFIGFLESLNKIW